MIVFKTGRYQLKAKSKKLVKAGCIICGAVKDCRECYMTYISPKVSKREIQKLVKQHSAHIASTSNYNTQNIGSFDKFIFPMIRQVWPSLTANDMLSLEHIYLCSDECISMYALKVMI